MTAYIYAQKGNLPFSRAYHSPLHFLFILGLYILLLFRDVVFAIFKNNI